MRIFHKPSAAVTVLIATSTALIACQVLAPTPAPTYEPTPEGFDANAMCWGTTERFYDLEVILSAYADDPELNIRAFRALRSTNVPDIWFYTADVQGPGYRGPHDIAIWWTRSESDEWLDAYSFAPYNDLAERFNQFPYDDNENIEYRQPETMGPFPAEATGDDLARECTIAALRGNEDRKSMIELITPGRFTLRGGDQVTLIVDVDPRNNRCSFIEFDYVDDDDHKWRASENADGVVPVEGPQRIVQCAYRMLYDSEYVLSDVDLGSIPREYRDMIIR